MLFSLFFLPFSTCNPEPVNYPSFYKAVIKDRNYSRLVGPYEISRKALEITIGIPFAILVSVDETQQSVTYIAAINMSWTDSRLAFDPNELGYDHIVIRSEMIWVPAVETFNSVELKFLDRVASSPQAQVHYSGQVYMWIKGRFDTICSCDIEAFPFDTQYCNMDFHTGLTPIDEEILIPQNGTELFIERIPGLPEWDIQVAPTVSSTVMPISDGRLFSMLIISFKLERNPEFYVYFLILPTMTITVTCMAALLLPIEIYQGERVNVGIAGLLGLTFMLSVIVVEVPRAPKLPLMGKWLIIQMFLCMAAMTWDIPKNFILEKFIKKRIKSEKRVAMSYNVFSCVGCAVFILVDVVATIVMFHTVSQKPPVNKIV